MKWNAQVPAIRKQILCIRKVPNAWLTHCQEDTSQHLDQSTLFSFLKWSHSVVVCVHKIVNRICFEAPRKRRKEVHKHPHQCQVQSLLCRKFVSSLLSWGNWIQFLDYCLKNWWSWIQFSDYCPKNHRWMIWMGDSKQSTVGLNHLKNV